VNPGDPVLLRMVLRGRVRFALPHRFVGMWNGSYGLFCEPGTPLKVVAPHGHASYLAAWVADGEMSDGAWSRGPVLRFMRSGERHALEVLWDPDWEHAGWYVNLQAPLLVAGTFFDTCDHALDVRVSPDGRWQWKDEDDFAEAIALGILDDDEAALVRAEAERVIAAQPWPTGWEDWRPPSEWRPLSLPADWAAPPRARILDT
jgi:hypothetical protein